MVHSSKVDRFLDGFQAAPLVGQVERLEYMGEGGVMSAYSLDRRLQVQETVLLGFKTKWLEFSTKVWYLTKVQEKTERTSCRNTRPYAVIC
jgi:hypothetical protein